MRSPTGVLPCLMYPSATSITMLVFCSSEARIYVDIWLPMKHRVPNPCLSLFPAPIMEQP